ncbi:hypothetical protein ACIPRL_08170 [Streptomyces sp. NPDC090085]|uniref:hypothetical protein n=1 Tax=Streptomyces sp. NPDC090085 TaxID=3365943 RepID=UPI003818FC2B
MNRKRTAVLAGVAAIVLLVTGAEGGCEPQDGGGAGNAAPCRLYADPIYRAGSDMAAPFRLVCTSPVANATITAEFRQIKRSKTQSYAFSPQVQYKRAEVRGTWSIVHKVPCAAGKFQSSASAKAQHGKETYQTFVTQFAESPHAEPC